MKKFFALPLAVLFAAACSEPTTSPAVSNSATLRPLGDFAVAGTGYSETFEGFGGASASPFSINTLGTIPNYPGTLEEHYYLGKFTNQVLTMSTDYVAGTYLNFSLIIGGTWDGNAKGRYGADTWRIAGYCGSSTTNSTPTSFLTSFSNKRTTRQSFPQALGASNPGLTNATEIGQLGFSSTGETLVTNTSVSTYSAVYLISAAYPTCATTTFTWVINVPSQSSQATYDEFWGLDNVSIGTVHAPVGGNSYNQIPLT